MITHYFTSNINPQLAYVATLYFKTSANYIPVIIQVD